MGHNLWSIFWQIVVIDISFEVLIKNVGMMQTPFRYWEFPIYALNFHTDRFFSFQWAPEWLILNKIWGNLTSAPCNVCKICSAPKVCTVRPLPQRWSPSIISIQNRPCNQSNGWFDFVYMWHSLLIQIEFQCESSFREKNNFDKASVGCDAANQARKRMDTAPHYHSLNNGISGFGIFKRAEHIICYIFKDYPGICELIWLHSKVFCSKKSEASSFNSVNGKSQLECFF